jgi:hypothetical protein
LPDPTWRSSGKVQKVLNKSGSLFVNSPPTCNYIKPANAVTGIESRFSPARLWIKFISSYNLHKILKHTVPVEILTDFQQKERENHLNIFIFANIFEKIILFLQFSKFL